MLHVAFVHGNLHKSGGFSEYLATNKRLCHLVLMCVSWCTEATWRGPMRSKCSSWNANSRRWTRARSRVYGITSLTAQEAGAKRRLEITRSHGGI